MRDIQASADVAGMVGTETLHRLRHSPDDGTFTCWHCGGRGDANTEPATVIAELGDGAARDATRTAAHVTLALAHAECSPSQVVSTDAAPLALIESGTVGMAARLAGAELWRTMLADLPGSDGFLPLLLLDVRPDMAVRSESEEPTTRNVAALLSMGLAPITTIGRHLAHAIDGRAAGPDSEPWPVPRATGWRLELSGRRVARLTAPDGSVVWGREFDQPFPWRRSITRTRRCLVLIGAVGLYPTAERPFTRITALLEQAAHAGELVGGLVEAGWYVPGGAS